MFQVRPGRGWGHSTVRCGSAAGWAPSRTHSPRPLHLQSQQNAMQPANEAFSWIVTNNYDFPRILRWAKESPGLCKNCKLSNIIKYQILTLSWPSSSRGRPVCIAHPSSIRCYFFVLWTPFQFSKVSLAWLHSRHGVVHTREGSQTSQLSCLL